MARQPLNLPAQFNKGEQRAKIYSTRDAALRSMQVGTAIVIAWNLPFAWYWRFICFCFILFMISLVINAFRDRGDRREMRLKPVYSRFREVYLGIADDVQPEEEELADLYAGGGGLGLLEAKGRVARKRLERAALWVIDMEHWLKMHAKATKEERLEESRRLLDMLKLWSF
jgi:hypothetical protein